MIMRVHKSLRLISIGIVLFAIRLAFAQEVTVTTERTEYKAGQNIKVIMANNLKGSIFSHVGSATAVFSIRNVQRQNPDRTWKKLFAQCQYHNCVYDIDAPSEIKPGRIESFVWEPLIYINGKPEFIPADAGTYCLDILYQVKGDPSPEKWDWKTVRTNQFTIR